MNEEILEAEYVDHAPTQSGELARVTPQDVYRALPVHKQSEAVWTQLKAASPEHLREAYTALVYAPQTTNNHYHTAPPVPPQIIVVQQEAPQHWEPPVCNVEIRPEIHVDPTINAYGGNAYAHAHAQSDGECGRPWLMVAMAVFAMFVFAAAIGGD